MAEFRRQEHVKVAGAAADERKALEDLKAVEAKLDAFARRAEEARPSRTCASMLLLDVFARSHELERSLEALKAELSTSEKGS